MRPAAGEFPSGQRGRAVNPLAPPSEVRILSPPSGIAARRKSERPCRRQGLSVGRPQAQDLRAAARPPLRPAAFFCAVVPPCFELPPEPDFLPPREDAPGELAIFAARSLDMPLSLRASYCFSCLPFALLLGMPVDYPAARRQNALRLGVDDDVRKLGVRPPDPLLDVARKRMRLCERAARIHREREERDETDLRVQEAKL